MKMKLCLTQERLKELLIYAPETGRFYWRKQHGPVNAGSEAGNTRSTGYRLIGIDKHLHYEHRLAWLYVYGVHPTGDIDHDNGNPADSRIATLRELPRSKNARAQEAQPIGVPRRLPILARKMACANCAGRQESLSRELQNSRGGCAGL